MYANIYRLVGNTFLIRTVGGWRKLLKYWGCYKHPFYRLEAPYKEGEYPTHYPVLVYCQNSLFEQGRVFINFQYISKEMANQLVQDLNLVPVTGHHYD